MKYNKTWLSSGLIIVLICVGFLFIRGLSQSIDFTGGRNYQVRFEQSIEPEQVRELMEGQFEDANVTVIAIGTDGKTVRISTNYRINEEGNNVDSEIEAKLYEVLKPLLTKNISLETFIDRDNHTGGSIISSQKVGPSIADDLKVAAVWAVIFAVLGIGLYILFRFRNIAYSVGSIAALTFDTILILGVYSMFWNILPFSMEIDQTFIGAILTAIGYSINDKVVIFDRVREYFHLYPKRSTFQLFNDSLNSTLTRTLFTGSVVQRLTEFHVDPYVVHRFVYVDCAGCNLYLGWRKHPQLLVRHDFGCRIRNLLLFVHRFADCLQADEKECCSTGGL